MRPEIAQLLFTSQFSVCPIKTNILRNRATIKQTNGFVAVFQWLYPDFRSVRLVDPACRFPNNPVLLSRHYMSSWDTRV